MALPTMCGPDMVTDNPSHSFDNHTKGSSSHTCGVCQHKCSSVYLLHCHRYATHNCCGQCDVPFESRHHLDLHQGTTGHCRCTDCGANFNVMEALQTHLKDTGHATHFLCCDCNKEFDSMQALEEHLNVAVHELSTRMKIPITSASKLHCDDCDRLFCTPQARARHFDPRTHRPKCFNHPMTLINPTIQCPLGKCTREFASPTALLQHMESGRCKSGMSRQKINEFILAQDTARLITCEPEPVYTSILPNASAASRTSSPAISAMQDIQNSIASSFEMLNPSVADDFDTGSITSGVLLTPDDTSSEWSFIDGGLPLTPSASSWSLITTAHAYTPPPSSVSDAQLTVINPFRCPLCPPHRPPFRSARALQSHLASPTHAPKIFHCPLGLASSSLNGRVAKERYFVALSALAQHLESGKCHGGKEMYERVVDVVRVKLMDIGFTGVGLIL